jgi:hypothetical protein
MAESNLSTHKFLWLWKGNENPWSEEEAEWKRYSDMENDVIEHAYLDGDQQAVLDKHMIDFERSLQINKNDEFRQRPIKRVQLDSSGQYLREDRFCFSEQPVKPFGKAKNTMSDFIWEWLEANRHIAPKEGKIIYEEIVEQAARGIVEEAKLLDLDFEGETIANRLRKLKNKTLYQIEQECIYLYSAESFLYKLINKTLREDDRSRVSNLGAFCYLLPGIHSFTKEYDGTLYRGVMLSQEMINDYENSIGDWRRWLAFSSTSKSREQAEHFGNTLFILTLKKNAAYRDISSISYYPHEEEVLLPAATDFVVDRIDCDKNGKYLIYISVYS